MKLSNLTEAKYQGRDTWVVQTFDPEEGILDWYAGPFNTESEAKLFADNLRTAIVEMLEQSGGEEEFGRFMYDETPRFEPVKVSSPDAFKHTMINSVRRQFQIN
jgi:hypothetical protein